MPMSVANVAPPSLQRVLETGLYIEDMPCARDFYETIMGLQPMFADDRVVAYAVGPTVLLLFRQGTTEEPARLPGGVIPPHAGHGRLHYAFAIAAEELAGWREHLTRHGVTLEGEVAWPRGGHSLYFRDPDQHLLELATPGLWPNY